MEWTVRELADRAGISSRTLRHYHQIGLLEPDRIGAHGYRFYGPTAVSRLQRILLLRDTGMPLARIASVVDDADTPTAELDALQEHLEQLEADRDALDRRLRAVEHTLERRRAGREPEPDMMLDGFNDRYEDEIVRRWGRAAFDASHRWWHAKSVAQQRAWKGRAEGLLRRWAEIHEADPSPTSAAAREHAAAHVAWFGEIPGTPTHDGDAGRSAAMIRGMADSYETDPDFLRFFGSTGAAHLAAASLRQHVSTPAARPAAPTVES